MKPPFKVCRSPVRQILVFKITDEHNRPEWTRYLAAWLFHHNYRPDVPNHLIRTHELPQPGEALPPLEFEVGITKVTPPYEKIEFETHYQKRESMVLLLPVKDSFDQEKKALKTLMKYAGKHFTRISDPFIRYFNNEEMVPEEELR